MTDHHVIIVGGRSYAWSAATGWSEITDKSQADVSEEGGIEALMRGRTVAEAESGRRALRRRAARRQQIPTWQILEGPIASDGRVRGRRPAWHTRIRPPRVILGGVEAT